MSELGARRLSCRELVALLTDYLDDALPAPARARVEAHLATCPDCATYLEQLRTTIAVVGRLHEEDVPEPVLGELLQAFRAWSAP